MSQDDGFRKALMQFLQQSAQRLLLCFSASVGWRSVPVQTSLIADAYRVPVVVVHMRSDDLQVAAFMYSAVLFHIIVVADVLPSVQLYVVAAALLEGVSPVAPACRAVQDDHGYDSHPLQLAVVSAVRMDVRIVMISFRIHHHLFLLFGSSSSSSSNSLSDIVIKLKS